MTDQQVTDTVDTPATEEVDAFDEFARLLDDNGNLPGGVAEKAESVEDEIATDDEAIVNSEEGHEPEGLQSAESDPSDIWSNATPEQQQAFVEIREQYARMEHMENSNRHRVSALQKKLNQMEEQQKAESQNAGTPDSGAADTSAAEDENPVDLATFKEDFPEVYGAMTALHKQEMNRLNSQFDEVRSQLQTVSAPLDRMAQDQETQHRQTQLQALAARHPDFQQIQDSQEFWGWIEQQSDGVKNLVGSTAAQDNSVLLDLYKSQVALPTPAGNPDRQAKPNRPRSAEAAATLPRKQGSRLESSPDENDADAAWEYWAKQANENRI